MDVGSVPLARKLDFLTEGRVKIEIFPAGKLGDPFKVPETIRRGEAQAGHTWMGLDWEADPTVVLFAGFAGSMDSEQMLHWLYEGGGSDLWRAFRKERFGLESMPAFLRTAEVFLHSRRSVRSLQDFKGLKIRTSGAWLAIAKKLGAETVSMPGGEVHAALARGDIDASEWGTLWENVFLGVERITSYVIVPGVHQPVAPFELLIDPAAWERLSARDRALVEMIAKQVTFESWTRIGQEDAKALKHYLGAGNRIVDLEPAFQRKVRELARTWAEEQAATNRWFARVWASQKDFEALWKEAPRYRRLAAGM